MAFDDEVFPCAVDISAFLTEVVLKHPQAILWILDIMISNMLVIMQ